MAEVTNVCAGPFGAFYAFYIERPRLAQAIGRTLWGIDIAPLYASMAAIGRLPDGAVVVDAPCGGGVALRALRPEQRVRWLAVDIDETMLARCEQRARERSLDGVEPVQADMRALPLDDGVADLALSYSGLHMIDGAEAAVAEIARVLKPGGELLGSTFLAEGSRRQRLLLGHGERTGQNGALCTAAELRGWLEGAGVVDVEIAPERGFAIFRGRRAA